MAMPLPPGNAVVSDKMSFSAGAGSGGGGAANEIHQRHQQQQQWFPLDERDGFISWLRGEFAAANAIIDSLCHHLQAVVGEPGEYELVIGAIQQRRCNWNPVLHMQQYFSVGEVIVALQQVALWRQQHHHQHHQQYRHYNDQSKVGGKQFRRSSASGFNKELGGSMVGKDLIDSSLESHSLNGNSSGNVGNEKKLEEVKSGGGGDGGKLNKDKVLAPSVDEGTDATSRTDAGGDLKVSGNLAGNLVGNSEAEGVDDGSRHRENDSNSNNNQNEKQNLTIAPKTFVGEEIIEGKTVNVVDGLKLYEKLLDDVGVSKLVSLVNDLRAAGRRGQFQGQTYVLSKRPMKGRGREMIQLGKPIADAPAEDKIVAASSKERRIEAFPALLQDIIDRWVDMQVMTVKPDSCIIDIYNEGDHSQPHTFPPWFAKPVFILFLTECDLTFGRVVDTDYPGDYRGSLKLALSPGSLLLMQGKSSDLAKHAIPTIRKQRILVTFATSQPRKFSMIDGQRLPSSAASPSSHWGPPPSRSLNHVRHPVPKQYAAIPTTGVLSAPPIQPQIPPPNNVQPLFVTAPVAAPIPYAPPVPVPPVSSGWPAAPPRHPSTILPLPAPGTGVFLPPPGSGNASSSQQASTAATEMNLPAETATQPEKEDTGKSDQGNSGSPRGKVDGKSQRQNCNGSVDGRTMKSEEAV